MRKIRKGSARPTLSFEPVSEEEQIERIVADVASKLGGWTNSDDLLARVVARVSPATHDRHRALIVDLCTRYAKRHNDSLER